MSPEYLRALARRIERYAASQQVNGGSFLVLEALARRYGAATATESIDWASLLDLHIEMQSGPDGTAAEELRAAISYLLRREEGTPYDLE